MQRALCRHHAAPWSRGRPTAAFKTLREPIFPVAVTQAILRGALAGAEWAMPRLSTLSDPPFHSAAMGR
jgi:hypothetical protein